MLERNECLLLKICIDINYCQENKTEKSGKKNLLVVHVVYYMIQAVDNYKWTGYLHPYSKYYVIKVHAYMLANGCVFKRYIHNIFFSNLAM